MPYPEHKPFRVLLDKTDAYLNNLLPFAIYRKPLSSTVNAVFQSDDQLHKALTFEEQGFVFAPFDLQQDTVLIKPDEMISATFETTQELAEDNAPVSEVGKEAHIALVKRGIQEINTGRLQKVVLSRNIEIPVNAKPIIIFKSLLERYSNAFCYLFFHPKVGLWCGASPETLVHIKAGQLQSMVLAATLPFTGYEMPPWSDKEREEHAVTSNDICKQLTLILEKLHVEEVQSVRAGNLWHLRSIVEGHLRPNTSIKEIITTLHPTPAVCGIPTLNAKAFIQEQEKYQRTFYTGFLGELNLKKENEVSLFVNLRCMRLKEDKALLFVGGGITAASNPENEWKETQDKSKVMLNALYNLV